MPTKNTEVAQRGADAARANEKRLAGAEDNPGAVAKRLHDQGKAAAAKRGG